MSWVNESAFCAELPVDDELRIGNITYKLYLKFLRGQTGLYHLWVDYDACDDHGNYTMLCVYVGKGFAELRVDSHVKKMAEECPAIRDIHQHGESSL